MPVDRGVQLLERIVRALIQSVCDLGVRSSSIGRHEHDSPVAVPSHHFSSSWINRHQQEVIEYVVAENRILEGQLRGQRLRLTDDERRRLAVKGKALGRQVLQKIATRVTPDAV